MSEKVRKKKDFVLDTPGLNSAPTLDMQKVQGDLHQLHKGMEEAAKAQNKEESDSEEPEEDREDEFSEALKDEEFGEVFDLVSDGFRKAQKTLVDKKVQNKVKELCEPLNVRDILTKGEFRQVVPIIKDEFEVEFRSIAAGEDLDLKKIMATKEIASERHFMDLYSFYQLTAGIASINGNSLPSHLGKDKRVKEEQLNEKMDYILRMPIQMTSTLMMHYYWFDLRVREMWDIKRTVGELKNG